MQLLEHNLKKKKKKKIIKISFIVDSWQFQIFWKLVKVWNVIFYHLLPLMSQLKMDTKEGFRNVNIPVVLLAKKKNNVYVSQKLSWFHQSSIGVYNYVLA